MGDKYTTYPSNLQKRIEKANKMIEDSAEYRNWWNSLSEEERARIEALPPEERSKEIERLFSNPNPNLNPDPDPNPDHLDNPDPDNPPAPSPEPETVESLKDKLEKAEQKYRTLKGMMKDTGEQERQINVLLSQIKMLQDQMHDLQQKTKSEEKPPKANIREVLKPHYDALAEDIAPDILEKHIKKDERLFEIIEERANQNISEVATRFDSTFAQTAKERFYKDLADWGDWETMWKTPEFQAFLDEEDGISGYKRIDIINDAFARLDSRPVLRAFNFVTAKVGKDRETPPAIDPNKVKNRIGAPRSSGPSLNSDPNKNKNQMSPEAARKALVALTSSYTRGLYKGSKEEYDKEYARLFGLARGGTG